MSLGIPELLILCVVCGLVLGVPAFVAAVLFSLSRRPGKKRTP